ncbi:MAG: hypothetical protein H8E13_16930 [Actinobacteria bacterium]|nr:hypothetical protein [Actinomycetota bacterium]
MGIVRGKYNLTYNLFRNILGSYEGNRVYINEISPSRKEIRVRPTSVETDEQGLLITTEE